MVTTKTSLWQKMSKIFVNIYYWAFVLHLFPNDFEVVVYEGVIREKPSSKQEARQFLKGLLNVLFQSFII